MKSTKSDGDCHGCDCETVRLKYLSIICVIFSLCGTVLTSVVISRQSDILQIHDTVKAVLSHNSDGGHIADTVRDVRDVQEELKSTGTGE